MKQILRDKDSFYVVGDDVVHRLSAVVLRPAFQEAIKLFPDLDMNHWIDENNVTQPVLFGVPK